MDFEKKWKAAMKAIDEICDEEMWAKFFELYCNDLGMYDE